MAIRGSFTIDGSDDTPATVATMVSGSWSDGQCVTTLGYSCPKDGGGNQYLYHESGRPAADGGFAIDGSGTDDWFEAVNKTRICAKQWGVKADGVTDDTPAYLAMAAYPAKTPVVLDFVGRSLVGQTVDWGTHARVSGLHRDETIIEPTITDGSACFLFNGGFHLSDFRVATSQSELADPLTLDDDGYCTGLQFGAEFENTTGNASRGMARGITVRGCWRGVQMNGWLNDCELFIARCITGFRGSNLNGGLLELDIEECSQYFEIIRSNALDLPGFQIEGSDGARGDLLASVFRECQNVNLPVLRIEEGGARSVTIVEVDNCKNIQIGALQGSLPDVIDGASIVHFMNESTGACTYYLSGPATNSVPLKVNSDCDVQLSGHADSATNGDLAAYQGIPEFGVATNLLGDGRFPSKGTYFTHTPKTRIEASWVNNALFPGRYALRLIGGASGEDGKTSYINLQIRNRADVFSLLSGGKIALGVLVKVDDDPAFPDEFDAGDISQVAAGIQPQITLQALTGVDDVVGGSASSNPGATRRGTVRLLTAELDANSISVSGINVRIILGSGSGLRLMATYPNAGIEILDIVVMQGRVSNLTRHYNDIDRSNNAIVSVQAGRVSTTVDARADGNNIAEYEVGDSIALIPVSGLPDRVVCTSSGGVTTAVLTDGPALA